MTDESFVRLETASPLLSDTDCQALQDIRADLLAIGEAVGDWGMPSVKISPNGWTMDFTVEFGQKVGTLTAQAFLMVLKNSPGRLIGAMGMLLGEEIPTPTSVSPLDT